MLGSDDARELKMLLLIREYYKTRVQEKVADLASTKNLNIISDDEREQVRKQLFKEVQDLKIAQRLQTIDNKLDVVVDTWLGRIV